MNARKNDVLASNLLFVSLAISVAEQLFGAAYYYLNQTTYVRLEPSISQWVGWQLLITLLQAAFYYAIRRGMFRAKVVVALACLYVVYTRMHGWAAYLAHANFTDLLGYPLLALLKNLLLLAALVPMFWKPRKQPLPV